MTRADCPCLELGPRSFDDAFVGIDRTNGRFGEVSVRTCRACGRRWLHYHAEYEGFSGSGRWYTGLLPEGADTGITAEGAVPLLQSLPWHVYGGSWFGSGGSWRRCSARPAPCWPGPAATSPGRRGKTPEQPSGRWTG